MVPTISAYWFQRSRPIRGGTAKRQKMPANRGHLYLESLLFVSAGFRLWSVRSGRTDPHFDHKAATTTTGPNPTPAYSDGGRRTSKSRPCIPVLLSCMYPKRHLSRSKLPVQQMFWMSACEMFWTLKCSTLSEK